MKQKEIGTLILEMFRKRRLNGNTLSASTYEIAKEIKISWSTANAHCMKLKYDKKLTGRMVFADIGTGKKMMWGLAK